MTEFDGLAEVVKENRTHPARTVVFFYDYEPTERESDAAAGCLLGVIIGVGVWIIFAAVFLTLVVD